MALRWIYDAVEPDMRCVHFKTDSQLMEKQTNGEYGVKHDAIIKLHAQVMSLPNGLDA